ncbi:MAG: ABC transporter permease [Filifactoraceae bacterium]
MLDLINLEFKKIIRKRLHIITTVGSIFLLALLFFLPAKSAVVYNDNDVKVSGKSAYDLMRERENKFSGDLSEEKVYSIISNYQDLFKDPNNIVKQDEQYVKLKDRVYRENVSPYFNMYYMLNEAYSKPYEWDGGLTKIQSLDLTNGPKFYEHRNEHISKLLNADYGRSNYSDKEKEFWVNKNSNVNERLEYGYVGGWKNIFNSVELFIIPALSICICLSSVFSEEYQTGADSLILTSKYGKSKIISAKIISAFIFTLISLTIHIIVALSIPLIIAGVDGYNLPIQLLNIVTPYNLNILYATIVVLFTVYLMVIGMVSLTLLMSAKFKSPYTTLVINLLLFIIPVFMPMSETSRTWNQFLYLLPGPSLRTTFDSTMLAYMSFDFFGVITDIVSMRMIVYIMLTLLTLPFIRHIFRNHQIS